MQSFLKFQDVSYHYLDGSSNISILTHSTFEFEKGKTYAIVGQSGSGKTTSLSLLGGLDTPNEGQVIYKDKDIKKIGLSKYRKNDISIVFQAYNLISYMNAYQNVVCAMDIAGIKEKDKKKKAIEILQSLGLSEEESKRDITKLSGGQQQRIAIARAIAKDVEVILCDEPTGNLDSETSKGIIQTFIDLAHIDHKCVIIVTHDMELASLMDVQIGINNQKLVQL